MIDVYKRQAIGDKVIAKAISRGNRHSEHRCELVSSHGSAETASACAAAILEANGISTEFPSEVQDNAARIAQKGISDVERRHRLDLTDLPIFTIDSAESKDLDDAISIEKGEHCYYVGVHIADVSHYVKYRSPLDLEAFERGTSIYYANKVVPMLSLIHILMLGDNLQGRKDYIAEFGADYIDQADVS